MRTRRQRSGAPTPAVIRVARWVVIIASFSIGSYVEASPQVIRMASITPEGTAWAREIKAFTREVEATTNNAVHMKWYLGAIAGDESASIARIRRGQLDGAAIAVSCSELAPSLRVTRIPGMFQRREEARHVFFRLFPIVEQEMRSSGFTAIAITAFGADVILSRTPVRSFEDLRRLHPWVWNLDQVWREELPRMGIHIVALPVEAASAAADSGTIDAFLALPTAALAYQWSTQMKYFTPLRLGYLPACLVMANRAFDPLPLATQQAIRAAGAKLGARFDTVNDDLESQLLGGLFERQGMKAVPVADTLRREFFEEARRARDSMPASVIPAELIGRVNAWLADYRAEHQ